MKNIKKSCILLATLVGTNMVMADAANPYEEFQKFNNQISLGIVFHKQRRQMVLVNKYCNKANL